VERALSRRPGTMLQCEVTLANGPAGSPGLGGRPGAALQQLALELEVDGEVEDHLDRPAFQSRRLVSPLADRVQGGLIELPGDALEDPQIGHPALLVNDPRSGARGSSSVMGNGAV